MTTDSGAASRPTKRNPMMILGITYGALFAASLVGQVLASATGVGLLATACSAGAYGLFIVIMMSMVGELKRFNGSDIAPWMVAIPLLNLWFLYVKVPEEMARARQKAGVQGPPKPAWMYVVLSPFALASDLNDLAA